MKKLVFIVLMGMAVICNGQGPTYYFNKAANEYIDTSKEQALSTINEGIQRFPDNKELLELKKRLEEEEQNQDQQNQDQQQQDQEQQDQEQQEGQENKNQEEQEGEQEETEEQQQEGEQEKEKSQEEMTKEKLKEMGISEEKARQLLEAMRQNEIKYLQHQKRKPTKRPPSGKPDW